MMLPILISVSVAPVSYFFCASTLPLEAANTTNAAEAMASLRVVTGIPGLPFLGCLWRRRGAFIVPEFRPTRSGIEYHLAAAIKKKPLRQVRKGCFFSSQ